MIYRPGAQTACEDLARAISFVFENAEELEVDTDCFLPVVRHSHEQGGRS